MELFVELTVTRLRVFWFIHLTLMTLVAVTFCTNEGDVIPGVRSRRPLLEQSSDALYVSYGGDPWGASKSTNWNFTPDLTWRRENHLDRSNATELRSKRKSIASMRRSKRGVVHLYNMVLCATGCNPLAYKGYGCYCGFLGSGFTKDGIDRCCKMHDWCYEATDCPMFLEYFIPYYWKCYRGYKPICAIEHGEWGTSGSCAQRLCECDRVLAECLRRFPCPTTKAVCTSSPWRLVQNLFMMM